MIGKTPNTTIEAVESVAHVLHHGGGVRGCLFGPLLGTIRYTSETTHSRVVGGVLESYLCRKKRDLQTLLVSLPGPISPGKLTRGYNGKLTR